MLKDFAEEHFDIIIQAGQSNSNGHGFGPEANPYQEDERIWYMNRDLTISPAAEAIRDNEIVGTFVLSFAREYCQNNLLQDGRKLLILRAAVNGSGFLDNHWKLTDDFYLNMAEMIRASLALNENNRLVGFLWHQGETDALQHATYQVHYKHLSDLLSSVCEEFHVPDIPFIAGDFVQDWKKRNIDICTPVVNAIRTVCDEYAAGAFVETEGLRSNAQEPEGPAFLKEDYIHFSRSAAYLLGERYFNAYLRLLESRK